MPKVYLIRWQSYDKCWHYLQNNDIQGLAYNFVATDDKEAAIKFAQELPDYDFDECKVQVVEMSGGVVWTGWHK